MAVDVITEDQIHQKMHRESRDQQERAEMATLLREQRLIRNEIIKREVIDNGRIDILATEVLGYFILDFHRKIMKHQYGRKKSLTLAPRDSGKSTICNYTKIIYEILRDPNVRIGLISNTQKQAEGFLKEIKNHLEGNDRLVEIFGPQVGPKWDTKEIVVKGKDSKHKDSTVSCIGVGSALIGKHFDMIVMDDAVTEEASRTELQRERQRVWFYQSLAPTMEPHAQLHVIKKGIFQLQKQ